MAARTLLLALVGTLAAACGGSGAVMPGARAPVEEPILIADPVLYSEPQYCPNDYRLLIAELEKWFVTRRELLFTQVGAACSAAVQNLIRDAREGCQSLATGGSNRTFGMPTQMLETAQLVDKCLAEHAKAQSGQPAARPTSEPACPSDGVYCNAYKKAQASPGGAPLPQVAGHIIVGGGPAATTITSVAAEGTTARVGAGSLEAAVINALADFVVARSKAEVLDYALDQFGKSICASSADGWDLRTFFRHTCDFVTNEKNEIRLDIRHVSATMLAAVKKDLANLLLVVLNYGFANARQHASVEAQTLLAVIDELRMGADPLGAFVLATDRLQCTPSGRRGCQLKVLGLAVRAFISGQATSLEDAVEQCASDKSYVNAALLEYQKLAGQAGLAQYASITPSGDQLCSMLRDVLEASAAAQELAFKLQHKPVTLIPRRTLLALIKVWGSFSETLQLTELRETLALVRTQWGRIEKWSTLGRALYAVIRAVHRGENPVAIVVQSARLLPCYDEDDPTCSGRALAFAARAVLSIRTNWRELTVDGDGRTATALKVMQQQFEKLVNEDTESALRAWCTRRFNGCVSMERLFLKLLSALQVTADLTESIGKETSDSSKRRALLADLYAATLAVWKTGLAELNDNDTLSDVLQLVEHLQECFVALEREDYAAFLVALQGVTEQLDLDASLPKPIRRYLPLLSELASARESKQIVAALEKHAAPVGTWRLKRANKVVSLTAFFGGTGGREFQPTEGWTLALFAPIGIDFTTRHRALGMYASILDLGAVTATRFDGDGEEIKTANVGFAQVLSPGLFVRFSLSGPITLGAGASVVPGLRDIIVDNKEVERTAVRLHAFLAVDLTLARLYVGGS